MADETKPTLPPTFDLLSGKAKDFDPWLESLHKWIAANPKDVVLPQSGWYNITPELALDFLRLDKPGANREVELATVRYYADQMTTGQWKKTGQSVLISSSKVLLDARHRLLAGLLSGATFPSYVITDVPHEERLFAYIDNSRARNPAAALQTAGFNGRSATVAQVCKLIDQMEAGAFTPSTVQTRPRLTPVQYLGIADRHPLIKDACRLATSVYQDVIEIFLDYKPIVAFLALLLLERYGRETTDAFFDELQNADASEYNNKALNDPLTILRAVLLNESRKEKQMRAHQVLGYAIKTFNLWREDSQAKRIGLRVDESFPVLNAPDEHVSEEDEEDSGPPATEQSELHA